MKNLSYDTSRCAGRYAFGDGLDDDPDNWCSERNTCARYMAFIDWDAKAGIPDYRGISVTMGRLDCKDKIEITEKTND